MSVGDSIIAAIGALASTHSSSPPSPGFSDMFMSVQRGFGSPHEASAAGARCRYRDTYLHGELNIAAGAIRDLPGYTGIALAKDCGGLDIYGTRSGLSGMLATAKSVASWIPVRGRLVAHDLATLLQIQTAITSDLHNLARLGLHNYAYWPDMLNRPGNRGGSGLPRV